MKKKATIPTLEELARENPIPTTFEGEVLAYEREGTRDFMLVRIGDTMKAHRLPIPRNCRMYFDTVPPRAIYNGEHPGATVSIDYATVMGRIDYNRVIGLRVKGNAPGAQWRACVGSL